MPKIAAAIFVLATICLVMGVNVALFPHVWDMAGKLSRVDYPIPEVAGGEVKLAPSEEVDPPRQDEKTPQIASVGPEEDLTKYAAPYLDEPEACQAFLEPSTNADQVGHQSGLIALPPGASFSNKYDSSTFDNSSEAEIDDRGIIRPEPTVEIATESDKNQADYSKKPVSTYNLPEPPVVPEFNSTPLTQISTTDIPVAENQGPIRLPGRVVPIISIEKPEQSKKTLSQTVKPTAERVDPYPNDCLLPGRLSPALKVGAQAAPIALAEPSSPVHQMKSSNKWRSAKPIVPIQKLADPESGPASKRPQKSKEPSPIGSAMTRLPPVETI
jgi:hypothetical protein